MFLKIQARFKGRKKQLGDNEEDGLGMVEFKIYFEGRGS